MKINIEKQPKKIGQRSFFNISLDNLNSFKLEILSSQGEKIGKKEGYLCVQKMSSNQNYNANSNQILLQKSFASRLTPKKQCSEEISQYLSDRNFTKNPGQQTAQKIEEQFMSNIGNCKEIEIRALQMPKLEEEIKQKILGSYCKNQNNEEYGGDMRSEEMQIENRQDERLPKRGLTFISKKLSEILRQKKRIKSSQLFAMSLFQEEEEPSHDERQLGACVSGVGMGNMPAKPDSKQRRNVRRRIYDSINVMVALGIIKKIKNQYIYIEQKDDLTDVSTLIQQEEILVKKKDFLNKLENDCTYKESCLKYLTQAYSKIKILRKLNVDYEEKTSLANENTRSSSQSMNAAPQQKIQFPFLLFENGHKDMEIELINNSDSQRVKKVNDWTDYIEVSNPSKQKEIEVMRIKGESMRIISDVDCINLLGSLEIQEQTEPFLRNQTQIMRDYEIINQHKLKKNEEYPSKSFNRLGKE